MILPIAFALMQAGQPDERQPDRWFGPDKLKHFFVAAFVQSVTYGALQFARVRHNDALIGAWAVTGAISVGKELHDRRTYGVFSVRDLVWDAAGAGAATLVLQRSVRPPSGDAEGSSPQSIQSLQTSASLLSRVATGPILRARASPTPAPRR